MPKVTGFKGIVAAFEYGYRTWSNPEGNGTPVVITYSFSGGGTLDRFGRGFPSTATYHKFTDAQQANFRDVADTFEAVSGLVFVEVTGNAMINLARGNGTEAGGYAYYPYTTERTSNQYFSELVIDGTGNFDEGSYEYLVMLHELGHSVGLSHPHEGQFTLVNRLDNLKQTVMTYNVGDVTGDYPSTLGRIDKAALKHLYGNKIDTSGWTFRQLDGGFRIEGSADRDVIFGISGKNRVYGEGGEDKLIGREKDDRLFGGGAGDRLDGHFGDDALHGDGGDDRLFGGSGDDTIFGGNGSDLLNGGENLDFLQGGAGHDHLIGKEGGDTLIGGTGNDTLKGGNGTDVLKGNDGHDLIKGGDGKDILFGGTGRDQLGSGPGNDTIFGGAGDDQLAAKRGDDWLYGGAGDDTMTTQDGTRNGMNHLFGGDGQDTLFGGNGRDLLRGGDGDDLMNTGRTGFNEMHGDAGNDTMISEGNLDRLFGGTGDDTLSNLGWTIRMYGGQGDDILEARGSHGSLFGGSGDDFLRSRADDTTFEGGAGNDILIGNYADHLLFGGGGDDDLRGDGEKYGGTGDDTLRVKSTAQADAGGGADRVVIQGDGIDVILGAGADTLVLKAIDGRIGVEVADFDLAVDRIDMTDLDVVFADLVIEQMTGFTKIAAADDIVVRLVNLTATDITADLIDF